MNNPPPLQVQNSGNAGGPAGQVLTIASSATFADGNRLATADGGRLVCQSLGKHDPAEGTPSVTVNYLAAVAPIPNREEGDPDVFALTTAFVDADGRLWQRTRFVSILEIWRAVLERPVLYRMFERPLEDPRLRKAESVTRRVLLEPIQTMCDMREHHLVEVIREVKGNNGAAPETILPYEDRQSLVFRFSFKYFGAAIGLIEEHAALRIASTGQLASNSSLLATIHPTTNPYLLVALNNADVVIQTEELSLMDLGTLYLRGMNLRPGWERPSAESTRVGDRAAWERALQSVGVEPAMVPAFKPNSGIRYEPITSTP